MMHGEEGGALRRGGTPENPKEIAEFARTFTGYADRVVSSSASHTLKKTFCFVCFKWVCSFCHAITFCFLFRWPGWPISHFVLIFHVTWHVSCRTVIFMLESDLKNKFFTWAFMPCFCCFSWSNFYKMFCGFFFFSFLLKSPRPEAILSGHYLYDNVDGPSLSLPHLPGHYLNTALWMCAGTTHGFALPSARGWVGGGELTGEAVSPNYIM